MADNENGPVDVTEHEKMFEGTIRVMAYVVAVVVVILVFLAIVGT